MAKSKRKKHQSSGLGDTVEKVIKATGLDKLAPDDCGCEEKKKALNNLLSYRLKMVNCPPGEDVIWYNEFKQRRTLTPKDEDSKRIYLLYATIFNRPYFEPIPVYSVAPRIKMITELDKVFK